MLTRIGPSLSSTKHHQEAQRQAFFNLLLSRTVFEFVTGSYINPKFDDST